jgi:hypothetical protein
MNSVPQDPSLGIMRPAEPLFRPCAARGIFGNPQCGPRASLSLRPLSYGLAQSDHITCRLQYLYLYMPDLFSWSPSL